MSTFEAQSLVIPEGATLYAAPDSGLHRRQLTTADLHPGEIAIAELWDGTLQVHDPLFDTPYRIGDRSMVSDPVADDVLRQSAAHFFGQLDTRQHNRPQPWEAVPNVSRMTRLGHMLSTAALTARNGGTPREIMAAGLHDVGHRLRSHLADALLEGSNVPHHDANLVDFLRKSGFIERLAGLGLLADETYLSNGVAIADLEYHRNEPPSFTYHPDKSNLEVERVQYIAQEAAIRVYPPDVARWILEHIKRGEPDMPDIGDQLYFTDVIPAVMFTDAQIRAYTEHWAERVALATDELQVILARRVLTSDKSAVPDEYRRLHPADALYALEDDWQTAVYNLAEQDPAVRGLLKIIDGLVVRAHEGYAYRRRHELPYDGPWLPGWASIFEGSETVAPNFRQHSRISRASADTSFLVLEMDGGTKRVLKPWVKLRGGPARRIDDVPHTDTARSRAHQGRWAGRPFDVVIGLEDHALGLSPSERGRDGVRSALSGAAAARWRAALSRPRLTAPELAARLARNAQRCRELGAVMVAPGSRP